MWLTHLQGFGCVVCVWMWPGSWDDSTIECLCPHPRFVPSQRRGGCWIFLCGVFVLRVEAPPLVLTQFCVCGVVVVPGCSGSTWWVFSLHFTGMYQNAGFSPPSPAQTTNKHTHTRSLASTNTANSNVCIKHLCSALSIVLGNFPQQTTAFTMINDVKWRKAVPEWDGRFFSAWKQQFDTD